MIRVGSMVRAILATWLIGIGLAVPAYGELILSDLVVELQPGKNSRKDIELWNKADERSYVEISPAEIVNPGQATESRRQEPNPERLGLLVSPNRMILEPGQHKIIRIAAIASPVDRERIYRVTVKPVVGDVSGDHTGLKVLVGYDVLAIVRPANPAPKIAGSREGRTAVIRNEGNSSAELLNGKQCRTGSTNCTSLPGKRLYAGAEWRLPLEGDGPVQYSVKFGDKISTVSF
jgi:P pilus assembly chaperone PapD